MGLTNTQITDGVSNLWEKFSLGLTKHKIGFYLNWCRYYENEMFTPARFGDTADWQIDLYWILAYLWALMRKHDTFLDWTEGEPSWRWGEYGQDPPYPKEGDISVFWLEPPGIDWGVNVHDMADYVMMVASFLDQIYQTWEFDTTDFYSPVTSTLIRKVATIIIRYLYNYGI
jgi:hypothetical protein